MRNIFLKIVCLVVGSLVFFGASAETIRISEYEHLWLSKKADAQKRIDDNVASEKHIKYYWQHIYRDLSIEERKKALPILIKKSEEGDQYYMEMLAYHSLIGALGKPTRIYSDKYYSKLNNTAGLDAHFTKLKSIESLGAEVEQIYSQYAGSCDDPYSGFPKQYNELSGPSDTIFLHECLKRYSVKERSYERLIAISQLEDLLCTIRESDKKGKSCISRGYQLLAAGNYDQLNDKDWFLVSAALRSIYKIHYLRIIPYLPYRDLGKMRSKTVRVINKAFKWMEKGKSQKAISYVDRYAKNPKNKLSDYEMASCQRLFAAAYYRLDNYQLSLSNYQKALDSNSLPRTAYLDVNKSALELKFYLEDYKAYSKHIAKLIASAPFPMELLPAKSLNALAEL